MGDQPGLVAWRLLHHVIQPVQLAPRLADAGSATSYRVDPAADYGPLQNLTKQRINTSLICDYWDDLLRSPARCTPAQ